MAITFTKSGYIRTPTTSYPATDRASVAFLLRINEITAFGMFHDVLTGPGFRVYANGGSPNAQQISLYGQASPTTGSTFGVKPKFQAGFVYHVAVVHDKDDQSRQFLAVNGIKYPFGSTTAAGFAAATARVTVMTSGTTVLAHAVQDLAILRGYAFTDDDIEAMLNDPAAAASIGSGSGAIRSYWSLSGSPGAAVAVGDAGISTPGDAARSFNEILGATEGSSILYSEPLEFVRSAAIGTPYVRASGKSICIPLVNSVTGDGLTPLPGGLATPPEIDIDGGPRIPLPTVAGGAYVNENTVAAWFPTPDGVRIEPGQVVRLHAQKDWLATDYGSLPALDGFPVSNRAGRPASAEDPDADPLRVGINFNTPSIIPATRQRISRNMAHHATLDESTVAGGKVVKNTGPRVIQQDGNSVDKVGPPLGLGLHAVPWDDDNPSSPTTISLTSGSSHIVVTEATAYRNPGDAEGRGKARVYDVAKVSATPTLAAAIDASTTTIRLTGTIAAWMTSTSSNDAYVRFGSETIRLGSRVGTTDQFTGCTRGWIGAAVAHAAGEAGFASVSRNDGILNLLYNNASNDVRYGNLALLTPGNWTVPETPGPVSIPPVEWHELDCDFLEKFGGGLGIMRFMDSTPTFRWANEVEHVTRKEDPHWGIPRDADQLRFATIRPFDPAVSPFMYLPMEVPGMGAETFPATLGTALGVQAAGEEATATLTSAPGDHLCYGARIMRGGETLRIKAILGGDSYRLVRGVDGTTPAAHEPGPVTVGWRVPFTAEGQWFRPGTRYFEVLLDPATSTPPRFGYCPDGTFGPDSNVAARRTLTLPDGAPSGSLTFAVVPADPGDWYYLAKDLTLVVGSEVMTIVAADEAGGTLTVARPSPASHADGVVGTTRTGKALWRNADDTSRIYKDPIYNYSIVRPTGPWSYLASANLTSAEAGHNAPAGVQAFDPATAAADRDLLPYGGIPYAMVGRICSLGESTWPWVNVPIAATDDLVRHIATEVRDHLTPGSGREVIVELANEVWNTLFKFHVHGLSLDPFLGQTDPDVRTDWWLTRQAQVVGIFREVFAADGRASQVKSVAAWQKGRIDDALAAARRLGIPHDYVSMAPYLEPPGTDEYRLAMNLTVDDAQACDLFATTVEFSNDGSGLRPYQATHARALAKHKELTGVDLPTIYYEGDLERATPTTGVTDSWARCRDMVYDPAYYFFQREVYEIFRRVGKCEAFAAYCHAIVAGGPTPHQWGHFQHPRQRWGYGDGRDGTTDNRLTRFRTASPLESPDTANVSVRFQAMLDHHENWKAAQGEPPPPPRRKRRFRPIA